jgi:hypothetical protein
LIRNAKKDCRNMNHGKVNPPVNFCPNCGEKFKTSTVGRCDEEKHRARRKDRNLFCHDCGKELSKP